MEWVKTRLRALIGGTLVVAVFAVAAISNQMGILGNHAQNLKTDTFDQPSGSSNYTFVESTMPWGWTYVFTNRKTFAMKFSGPVDESSISSETLTLSTVDSDLNVTGEITGTVSYDPSRWAAYFKATESLPSGGMLKFDLTGASDLYDNTLSYSTYFYVDTVADTTAPTITWTSPVDDTIDVDTLTSNITFGLSEQLDSVTIMNASSDAVFVASPDFDANIEYDPYYQSLSLSLMDSLIANTSYTITLDKDVIKDTSDNYMASDYVLSFTTGAVNNNAPQVNWSDFSPYGFNIGFDLPMKSDEATDDTNYTLECDDLNIDLSTAYIAYNSLYKEVNASGLSLDEGSSCTLELSADIQATNGQSLEVSDRTQEGEVESFTYGSDYYDDTFSNYDSSTYDYVYQDPNVSFFNPFYSWPECSITSCNTTYSFSFPVTQAIGDGDKIELTFPAGFDIENASINSNDYRNTDINGWEEGKVTIEDAEVNISTSTVSLTLDSDVTLGDGVTSQLNFAVSNIANPSTASEYDWGAGTGGYQIAFQTVDGSTSEVIEGPNNMQAFSVREGGDGEITITVLEKESEDPIEGLTLSVWAGEMGNQTIESDENGEATLTGIPVNDWGNYISVWSDPQSVPDGYLGEWLSSSFYLTTEAPTGEATMYLKEANLQISGAITHTGIGSDGETNVNLWCNSWTSWTSKKITLDTDGSTAFSVALADEGWYNCGVDKFYDYNSGTYDQTEYVTPSPQSTELTEDNSPATLNFALEAADNIITGTVTDQDGNPLPYAYVSISSDHSSDKWFWSGTSTGNDGSYRLAVSEGKYIINANYWGIPGSINETIDVAESDTEITKDFVLKKPDISITGNVSDGSSGMQWAGVSGWSTNGQWVSTNTDADGTFTMFVNPGTWNFSAWGGQYGQLPAASGVDVSDVVVTDDLSDINFEYDPNAFADITGILEDADGEPMSNIWLWTDKIDTETNNYLGWGNGAMTGSDGSFTINSIKNTDTEEYRLAMWDMNLGHLLLDNSIDISDGDVDLGTVSLPQTYTVTGSVAGIENGQTEVWINFENTDTYTWSWMNLVLEDGAGTATVDLADGDYRAHLHLFGLGEFSEEFTVSGANTSFEFDLSDIELETITINVTDSDGEPLENSFVEAFDQENDRYINGFTDENGDVDLTLVAGDSEYTIRAVQDGYAAENDTIDPSTDTEGSLALVIADSVIEGQALDSDDEPMAYVWVDAVSEDGTWIGGMTDGEGNYELDVPSDTVWDITIRNPDGTYGVEEGVADGEVSADVVLDQERTDFIPADPFTSTIDPTIDNVLTDELVDLTIPGGSISEDDNGNNLSVNKTAAAPETDTTEPLGGFAFDIDVTDSSGNNITTLNSEVTVEFKYTKEDIDLLIEEEVIDIADIDAPLSYFNEANDTWEVISGSTVFAEVQEEEGDDYTTIAIADFIDDYETLYADVNDFEIHYLASVDHFTLFAPSVSSSGSSESSGSDSGSSNGGGSGGAKTLSSYETSSTTDDEADSIDDSPYSSSEDDADQSGDASDEEGSEDEDSQTLDYSDHWAQTYIAELYDREVVSGCDKEGDYCPDSDITRAELLKLVMNLYGISKVNDVSNPFTDIEGHWAKDYILTAYDAGIINGYNDHTFKPDAEINRAEAMKVVLAAAGISVENKDYTNPFKDVPSDQWYKDYVLYSYEQGVVKGYLENSQTYFKPDRNITRAEMAKISILVEALME